MNSTGAISLLVLTLNLGSGPGSKPLYQNDFEKAALDTLPAEFVLMDGGFSVKEHDGNKVLELPGAPLDSYGLFFGPAEKEDVLVSARIFGTAQGRRYPAFGVGLNGAAGYRLQVSPGKKQLELYRGDVAQTGVPYDWKSGKWTHLQLSVRKSDAGWQIEGKAWVEGADKPAKPLITTEAKEPLPSGRASISGHPFAGTPIWFDDLRVARLGDE